MLTQLFGLVKFPSFPGSNSSLLLSAQALRLTQAHHNRLAVMFRTGLGRLACLLVVRQARPPQFGAHNGIKRIHPLLVELAFGTGETVKIPDKWRTTNPERCARTYTRD
jgi:hypothetical protein